MDYTIFQGSTSYIDAETLSSVFIMSDGYNKYTSSDIEETGSGLKIKLGSSVTSGYIPGIYTYQVVNPEGLEKQGSLKVKANLLYTEGAETYWKKVLRAVDDKLAGRATEATTSVHVGDKSINYMTLTELLQLREFALQKVAEEEAEDGAVVDSPNNEHKILFAWRYR